MGGVGTWDGWGVGGAEGLKGDRGKEKWKANGGRWGEITSPHFLGLQEHTRPTQAWDDYAGLPPPSSGHPLWVMTRISALLCRWVGASLGYPQIDTITAAVYICWKFSWAYYLQNSSWYFINLFTEGGEVSSRKHMGAWQISFSIASQCQKCHLLQVFTFFKNKWKCSSAPSHGSFPPHPPSVLNVMSSS